MKHFFVPIGVILAVAAFFNTANAVTYAHAVQVTRCQPSLNASTFVEPGWVPGYYPVGPYYWPSVYGYRYYQPRVRTTDPQLGIDYTNTTNKVMKDIEFGLVANGNLVAEVKDAGTFSPGVEIKHTFGISRNVFPIQTALAQCVPLKITFADGTKWRNPRLPALKHKIGLGAHAAARKPTSTRLQGTVVSVTASSISLSTSHGNQTAAFDPKLRVLDLTKSSLDKVQNNSFIGTTVVPQPDGTYTSTEVHIFAESLRGMGEGFTKMNSTGSRMMANAAVHVPSNMMANSTVRAMSSNAGSKTLSMTFPTGKITVQVPQNVPVSYISPASRSLLQKGKSVLAVCNGSEGKFTARTIVVMEPGTSLR